MYEQGPVTIVNKKTSALGLFIAGVSLVIVTMTLCATGITLYGMRVIHLKTQNLGELVGAAAQSLNQLREALPPAVADAWLDERRPDYVGKLNIDVRLVGDSEFNRRVVVEVENSGEELVSQLSLRVIALDEDGEPLDEFHTWAATPMQLDRDWRGPIQPHSTRRFTQYFRDLNDVEKVTYEVSDVRVWRAKPAETLQADASPEARGVAFIR